MGEIIQLIPPSNMTDEELLADRMKDWGDNSYWAGSHGLETVMNDETETLRKLLGCRQADLVRLEEEICVLEGEILRRETAPVICGYCHAECKNETEYYKHVQRIHGGG